MDTKTVLNIEYDLLARKYKLADYLKFSTKEAAEEYILMNKPCLSINDVNSDFSITKYRMKQLKKLVKSRY